MAQDDEANAPRARFCACPAGARLAEQEREEAAHNAERLRYLSHNLLGQLNLPRRLAEVSFDSAPQRDPQGLAALEWLRRFGAEWDRKRWLVVRGEMGVGKTCAVVALVRELAPLICDEVFSAAFVTTSDLVLEYQAAMRYHSEDEVVTRYADVDLLILDDLGAEDSNWWREKRIYYPILNRRYDQERPTIITTNLALEAEDGEQGLRYPLLEHVGERVFYRILENATIFSMAGLNLHDPQSRQEGKRALRVVGKAAR